MFHSSVVCMRCRVFCAVLITFSGPHDQLMSKIVPMKAVCDDLPSVDSQSEETRSNDAELKSRFRRLARLKKKLAVWERYGASVNHANVVFRIRLFFQFKEFFTTVGVRTYRTKRPKYLASFKSQSTLSALPRNCWDFSLLLY